LLRLAEEGLQSPDRPVRFSVQGDGGRIPAAIASPLSVVLTELLQNAVDHGFPEGSGGGSVVVKIDNRGSELALSVIDDGRGVDAGFQLEQATGLGLSIVRTLVTTELNGRIDMRPLTAADRELVGIGSGSVQGTVVDLAVPLSEE
jgi:two-component sensor histidine kinase